MVRRFSRQLSSVVAVAALTICAALASVLFADRPSRTLVPLVFSVVVVAVSIRFGALAGIVSSLLGAGVFAGFLFPPFGKLRVEDAAARAEIGWMLLAGITLSYLLAGPALPADKKHPK